MNELSPGRYIAALFADDIREEVGGKLSIIGVYQERLLVAQFPYVLPKLAILLIAGTTSSQPFTGATFELLKDGVVVSSSTLSEDALCGGDGSSEDQSPITEIQLIHVINSFVIDGPVSLQVRLRTEQGTLVSRFLRVGLLNSL